VIGVGLVASASCGGSVADEPTGLVAPDAGPPSPPPKTHPKPPDDDASVDAPDLDERDFKTTLVADEPGAEVQLAVSALTRRIVVAWIGMGGKTGATIRAAISDDQGATFGPAQTVGETVGDPFVAALEDGSFLVGGLRADCSAGADKCANGEIFLGRIAVGTTGISMLPSIHEPPNNAFVDHAWMSVHGGDVSIIGAAFPLVGGAYQSGMTAWKSTDKGQTWTRSEIVAPSAGVQIGVPRFCAGDGNRLFAHFYDEASATEGTLRFTDTADDGWTTTNSVNAGGSPAGSLVTEGACVVKGDSVYMLLGTDVTVGGPDDAITPVYSDIHLLVSNDLGKTWSDRVTINKPASQYLLPEIDLEPDGTVDIFYYRGMAAGGVGTAEMARVAGTSVTTLVVRDGLFFINDRGSARWLGDYNGIGYLDVPIVAFGDNMPASTQVRFGRMKR
jgi:hypothetical protein